MSVLTQQQQQGAAGNKNIVPIFSGIVSFLGVSFIAPACSGLYILLNEYTYLMSDHQKRTIQMYYNMSVALLCFYGISFLFGVLFNHIPSKVLQSFMLCFVFITVVVSIIFPAICLGMGGLSSFPDIELKISNIRQKNQTLIRYSLVYNLVVLLIFSIVLVGILFIDCELRPKGFVSFGIITYFSEKPSCSFFFNFLGPVGLLLRFLIGRS